jgi:hypothetical protein
MHYLSIEVYLDILNDPEKQEKLGYVKWAQTISNTEFPSDMLSLD